MAETAIKIENLTKQYRLGAIGGQTLNAELQSWWARKRGKEDPNLKIGQTYDNAGEKFMALKGINLEIKKGEAVGIIGGNGAGKSTLLKILSRVTAPTSGDVWINGKISSMLEVGTGFHGELTGRENIYMNGAILGMTKKEVDAKIESIIDFSECRQFIDTPVKRYSSGMYVKLAFAVASHLDADIMVMDEVLAVGDMKFQKKCLKKMGDEAHGGKTVLYVSHNMNTIRELCSRCVVLERGRIIFDGDVEQAIAIYMNSAAEHLMPFYDFSQVGRHQPSFGYFAKIESVEFVGRERPCFSAGEEICMEVAIWAREDIQNLRLAISISGADCSIAGMTEMRTNIAIRAGETKKVRLKYDPRNLVPGIYRGCVFAYKFGSETDRYDVDEIPSHIWFEMVHDVKNVIKWEKRYWGNVRLSPLDEV